MNRMDKQVLREISNELGAHKETLEAMAEDERDIAILANRQDDDSLEKVWSDLADAAGKLEAAIQILESYF